MWRYSRIDELDLDALHAAARSPPPSSTATSAGPRSPAATTRPAASATCPSRRRPHLAARRAGQPTRSSIDVPAGVDRRRHRSSIRHPGPADAVGRRPQLVVRAGADSEVRSSSCSKAAARGSSCRRPRSRSSARPGSATSACSSSTGRRGRSAPSTSTAEAQASVTAGLAGFGGDYARVRTDCRLVGRGATGDLLAAYFGDGDQTLDYRTFQDHIAPDTTSNLLFKGTVSDRSRSVYTGLIRVAKGARGTNASENVPGAAERIRGYRGGYLPMRRREIEKGLRDGDVRAVVSTNALELGIDIGALDVSVMAGYPGTMAATWQRAGRAGRRASRSAAVMVASQCTARSVHRPSSVVLLRPLARAGADRSRQPAHPRRSREVRGVRAAVRRRRAVRALRRPGSAGGARRTGARAPCWIGGACA